MFRKSSLLGSSTLSSAPQTTYSDVRGEDIMSDPRVVADVRKEFEDRGIYIADDDELMRKFYDDQTFSKLNATIGPFNAYQRAEAATPESRARQARLRDAHNKLPAFFQKGGVGAGTALPSYAKALVLDPINLVGGFIGAGGKGVAKAAQIATMAGKSPTIAAAKAGALRGAAYEGALGAGFGAVYSVGNQNVDIKLGLQDQFSLGRLAADVAGEAAFSAGIGGALGGAGGAIFRGGAARLDPDVPAEETTSAAAVPTPPAFPATPTPDQHQMALLQDAAAASGQGKLDLEDDLVGEYIEAMSYDTSAVTFAADGESPVSLAGAPTEAATETTEAVAGEAAPEAVPEAAPVAGPDMSKRTNGKVSVKAQKAAAENNIDVTTDPKTGSFNDPELEQFVISRAMNGGTTGRVTNSLSVDDIRDFITSRGAEPVAEATAETPTSVAAKVVAEKQAAETRTGQKGTPEDTAANAERAAEEAGVDPAEAAAIAEAIANNPFPAEFLGRFTALDAASQQQVHNRVQELKTSMDLTKAVEKAFGEVDRAAIAGDGPTPARMADRTAKSMEELATGDELAGRSLVENVDPATKRTTRIAGGLQKILRKSFNLPTFNSVERNYAEMLARESLTKDGPVFGRDILGKKMEAGKRQVADLTDVEKERLKTLTEELKAAGKPEPRKKALAQINREFRKGMDSTSELNAAQDGMTETLSAQGGYVVYKSSGSVKAATTESFDEMAPRGSIVIYSADMNKSFAGETLEEAREALDRVLQNQEMAPAAKRMAKEADDRAVATFLDKNGATRFDYGATSSAADDKMLATPMAKADQYLVAVYTGPKATGPSVPIRQATAKQAAKGGTFRDLIGLPRRGQPMADNWNPDHWELYFAPLAPPTSNKQAVLEEAIKGQTPFRTGKDDIPLQRKSYDDKVAGAPLFSELAELDLPVPETDEEQTLFKMFIDGNQPLRTFKDLLTREAEMWRVGLKDGNAAALISKASLFYGYMSRVLPQGITYPQATRAAAYRALEGIYRDADTETLEMLKRLMAGVKSDGAPNIVGEAMPFDQAGTYRPAAVQVDEVGVQQFAFKSSGTIALNPQSLYFHPMHAMLHELGHWSTDYVLTPRIKADWFKELATYIDDSGNLRLDKLGLGDAPEALDVGSNFQEVFANLFTKWGSDKVFRKSLQAKGMTFFEKLGKIFNQLFDFFMSGGVPENFDPIFSNILGDTERLIYRIDDLANPPKDKTARAIQSRYDFLQELKGDWTAAVEQGGALEGLAIKTVGFLHSLTNTKNQNAYIARKSGGSTRGNNTGTFEPVAFIAFPIRKAIADINELVEVIDTSKSTNQYGYNPEAETLPFLTTEFDPVKYERIAQGWTGVADTQGVIAEALQKVDDQLRDRFEAFAAGQYQMKLDKGIKAQKEKASIGPSKAEKTALKKGRWKVFANSAFSPDNVNKTDETLAKNAAKVSVPVDASVEELAGLLDFTPRTGPLGGQERAIAQLIKRKLDAEPVYDGPALDTSLSDPAKLYSMMLASFHANDMDDFAKYRAAYRSVGGKENMPPQDGMVDALRLTEISENGLNQDGVSLNARPQIQRLQEKMNVRRDDETASTMRQLFFRTMNLVGGTKAGDGPARESVLAPLFGLQPDPSGPALTEDSPLYRNLRTQLRQIALGLKNGEDTVRDLALLAIRGSNDLDLNSINGRPADEFMADAVVQLLSGKTTFDRVFPNSPDRSVFLQRARNYMDRTGYLANGLVASKSLRKKYPGLTVYGDMFATNKRPITAMHGVGNAVAPEVAADAFSEVLKHGTAQLRAGIQRFTKGAFNVLPNGMPTAMYIPVRRGSQVDNQGRAQTNGMFGMATYISSDPVGALRTKNGDIPARTGMEAQAQDLVERVASIDEDLLRLRGQQAMAETSAEALAARDRVSTLLDQREGLLEKLDDTGRSFDDVAPVVTRAQSIANFQETAQYGPNSEMTKLLASAITDADQRAGLLFGQTLDDVTDGDDLFMHAVDVLERAGLGSGQARNVIIQRLRAAGYDGIAGTINDEGAARPVYAIFNGDDIRSLRAPDLPIEPDEDAVLQSGVGASFWELVASETKLPPSAAGAVEDHLGLTKKVPGEVAKAISEMITGSRATVGVQQALRALIDGAEQRLQKAGMGTLSAKFNDFTAEHTRKTGQIIMPMLEGDKNKKLVGLNNLPGMPANLLSKVSNYMTTSWQGNKVLFKNFDEPAPLGRIRAAMIDPKKVGSLANDSERQMYKHLRGAFQKQLERMQTAGILVGDLGPDYFPQVWNPEYIRRDEEGFKGLMFSYFKEEQRTASNDEAKAFADKIYSNITNNDTGVVDFDPDSPKALIDSADFTRLLKFHQVAPELLESAQKYQEQSLMATVVRYFDETERVIQQADYFGVNGHGIMDYAKAAQEGKSGIIELLQSEKRFTTNRRTVGPDGLEQKTETIGISMLPPALAKKTGEKAFAEAQLGNFEGARKVMYDAYAANSRPITYTRRVDAIIDALKDFKGKEAQITQDDLIAVNGYSRLIMRKSASKDASQSMRNVSRSLRAFQNVTLLSYATISSFSDLAMPIIRSGDFKAAWQGWSKYIGDKDYRDTIRRIGIAMDGITHERMAQLVGDGSNIVQSTFFKMTGLTPWTNMQRAGAAAIGEHGLRHHMEALKKMGPAAQSSPAYNRHARELIKFGMSYDPSQPIPKLGGGTPADEMFERAVIRFTDATIFSPKPHDMPLFANSPWGAMVYQLKSFAIMYGRFAKEMTVDEAGMAWQALSKGDYGTAAQYMKKPALLMTLGPAVAAGSIAGKDLVMARGGEEGQSVGINQTTKLSNTFGPEWSNEQLDAMSGWYFQSFMQAGGLGLLGDIFRTTAEQQDNGAYGRERIASTILGPTFGLFNDALKISEGVGDAVGEAMGGEGSPGKQRQAIRSVVGRAPLVGGNRALKEALTDLKPVEGKSSGIGGSTYKRTTYGTTDF